MTALALQPYNSRRAPEPYSAAWFDAEHQNIQRALAATKRLAAYNTAIDGGLTADSVFDDRTKFNTLVNTTMQPNGGQVDVVGIVRIASDMTIPSNIELNSLNGGYLAPDGGVTVTTQAAITSNQRRIFGGGGTMLFSDSPTTGSYAAWWGASVSATAAVNKGAITSAINSNNRATTVWCPRGELQIAGGIDFLKAGVMLSGASPSACWAGYGVGGTVLNFTSGTYGFSLMGTQIAPVGGNVCDGSGLQNMTIQSATQWGVGTGVKFCGPKFFWNLQVRRFGSFGIQCQDSGIGFDIDMVFLFDIGPLAAQSGKAIQVTGGSTTTYTMGRIWISNCWNGIEIKAGLNFEVANVTIEKCTAEALLLTNVTGQSLADGTFRNIWTEDNSGGTYNLYLSTVGASAGWYAAGMTFDNCRFAPITAGQRPVFIGANVTQIIFKTPRLGGTAADSSTFNSPVTLIDPVGPYYVDATSLYNVTYSTAAASITQSPAGWQIVSAGGQPAPIAFPDGTTITLTLRPAATGKLLLGDAGSANVSEVNFGPGVAAVRIIDDGIGAVVASAAPAIGKFGIWKPTASSLAIKNAVGARTITLQISTEVLAMSNPV